MKAILLEDVIWNINDNSYLKGEEVNVIDLEEFPSNYAIYTKGTLDWIPKHLVELL